MGFLYSAVMYFCIQRNYKLLICLCVVFLGLWYFVCCVEIWTAFCEKEEEAEVWQVVELQHHQNRMRIYHILLKISFQMFLTALLVLHLGVSFYTNFLENTLCASCIFTSLYTFQILRSKQVYLWSYFFFFFFFYVFCIVNCDLYTILNLRSKLNCLAIEKWNISYYILFPCDD